MQITKDIGLGTQWIWEHNCNIQFTNRRNYECASNIETYCNKKTQSNDECANSAKQNRSAFA